MQTVQLPAGVTAELEKLNRDFLWGDREGHRRMPTVAWRKICRPKEDGGLAIPNLKELNIALFLKLGWHLISKPNLLSWGILAGK